MQNKVPIIILSDNKQTRSVLELYLSAFEYFEVADEFPEYLELFDNISSCDKSILIVDLSYDADTKLAFISDVTQNIRNCRVLAVSDNPSVDLIVRAMRSGAKEFLPLPLIKTEFVETIIKLNESLYSVPKKNTRSKII